MSVGRFERSIRARSSWRAGRIVKVWGGGRVLEEVEEVFVVVWMGCLDVIFARVVVDLDGGLLIVDVWSDVGVDV